MRITDAHIYTVATRHIMNARAASAEAGDQVSSGIRVVHAWDDASAAGAISRQANQQARHASISTAAQRASEELVAADGALDQVTTSITRAHELAVQLGNDTYSAADRAGAAAEIKQLMTAVVSQLNVKSGDRYVFGGMLDGAPPFDTTGAYLGDTNVRQVEVAPGLLQDASLRADQALKGGGGGVDVLTELANLNTALLANDGAGIRAAVGTLGDGITQISTLRSHGGALMNAFDVAVSTAKSFGASAQGERAKLEEVDIFEASTRLAATQSALQASMSAASKQFSLSLLDKL
jgi:flagellar hook-associated protein 3 FlgL